MELKFNEAKTVRPNHLERCLCYDKFLKGYRCYVYDDISKYWCTQATTEHDPNGDNHIVDYADYQVTKWTSLQQEQPDNEDIDKVAQELYEHLYELKRRNNVPTNLYDKQEIIDLWKAGIEYGRNHPKQEQPEVDLEEEVKRWKNKHGVVGMDDLWLKFASYFWNKGYNARKEE